ncbi:MAG: hypothetical protein ACP5U1_04315 [Desulfomonilaceae bacterium]
MAKRLFRKGRKDLNVSKTSLNSTDHSKRLCLRLLGIMDTEDRIRENNGRIRELTTQVADFELISLPTGRLGIVAGKSLLVLVRVVDPNVSLTRLVRSFANVDQKPNTIRQIRNSMLWKQ